MHARLAFYKAWKIPRACLETFSRIDYKAASAISFKTENISICLPFRSLRIHALISQGACIDAKTPKQRKNKNFGA